MVNAAAVAALFVAKVHSAAEEDVSIGTPGTTSHRQGFVHILSLHGDVATATVPFILRDFSGSSCGVSRLSASATFHW